MVSHFNISYNELNLLLVGDFTKQMWAGSAIELIYSQLKNSHCQFYR